MHAEPRPTPERSGAFGGFIGPRTLASQAVVIGDEPPVEAPLVMGWVHETGEQMFVPGF